MWKLIKMEWKKNCLGKMIRNAAIMTTAVLLFVLLTAGEAGADMAEMGMFNKSFIHASVELYTHMSYMIFTGVLLAGFVVDDYKKGTIRLLFSYRPARELMVENQHCVYYNTPCQINMSSRKFQHEERI